MAKRKTSNDSIGRGKPPRDTRFKPGQSGNAKGRPKGSNSLAAVLQREIAKLVFISEGGTRKKISMQRVVVKQLINKAASGDPRIMSLLLKQLSVNNAAPTSGSSSDVLDGAPDQLVMENIIERILKMDRASPAAAPDDESGPSTEILKTQKSST